MKRRQLFSGGFAVLAGSVLPMPGGNVARSQPVVVRAAVVIGVDKCDPFIPLNAASSGAREVSKWLRDEGFNEVHDFIDDGKSEPDGVPKPVRVAAISDKIEELLKKDGLRQLVLYFAGHGMITASDDVWLLSKGGTQSGEMIGVNSSYRLAKQSNIPSVVFLSDACRLPPRNVAQVQSSPVPIFPSNGPNSKLVEIDKFSATQVGYAASEFEIEEKYQGVFTATLLKAFMTPAPCLVDVRSNGEKVIPNRKLQHYLRDEVPKRASAKDFRLKQVPECDVPSSDDIFIARFSGEVPNCPDQVPVVPVTISDISTFEIERIIERRAIASTDPFEIVREASIRAAFNTTGFRNARDDVGGAFNKTVLWNSLNGVQTGFVIAGRRAVKITVPPGVNATINENESGVDSLLSLAFEGDIRACSVAIRFEDGTGTILAGLLGFVGTVSTTAQTVTNVAYDRNDEIGYVDPVLQKLRSTAAAAFQFGVLRFRGTQEERQQQAEKFGDEVRIGKTNDPSLGIYAAYAFDEASLPEKVLSVGEFMRRDLGSNIFDVELLGGSAENGTNQQKVVPCCPMLSVGWSYLASSKLKLPETVSRAQEFLIASPWTLLEKEGMDILERAIETGTVE